MPLNLSQGRNFRLNGNAVAGKLNSAVDGRLIEMVQRQGESDIESGITGRLNRFGDSAQTCVQWRIIGETHHILRESRAQQVESNNRAIKIGNRGVDRAESYANHLRRIKAGRHPIAYKGQFTRDRLGDRPALGIRQPNPTDRHIHTKRTFTGLRKREAVQPALQTHLDIVGLSTLQRQAQPRSQLWTQECGQITGQPLRLGPLQAASEICRGRDFGVGNLQSTAQIAGQIRIGKPELLNA